MPSRRHHAKTTTGCTSCKARRVKCGEERPICKACVRRNTQCIYAAGVTAKSQPSVSSECRLSETLPSRSAQLIFDTLDLSLMHRYCTTTSIKMFPQPSAQNMWQMVVPIKAESYAVLQHAILALAAFDLAAECCSSPDKSALTAKYRARGLYHQQAILPTLQEMLTRQDAEHANIQFLLSVMLIILAFASMLSSPNTDPAVEDILEVFALFRGPRVLWGLRDTAETELTEVLLSNKEAISLNKSENWRDDGTFATLQDRQLDEVCVTAMHQLQTSWATVQSQPDDLRGMAYFPAMVTDEFCEQLRSHQENALLILRHFSAVVKAHEERWWIGRWSEIVERAADAALAGR